MGSDWVISHTPSLVMMVILVLMREGSYKMRNRESTKVNMYKMRKSDAKDFAFYTSPF